MKTCGECGAGYEDHMEVCLMDGAPLVRDTSAQAPPAPRTRRPRISGWMVALAFLPALSGLVAIALIVGVVALSTTPAEAARPVTPRGGAALVSAPLLFLPKTDDQLEAPRSEQAAKPERRRRRRVPRLNRRR